METKITLEGLIAEMRRESYDDGYNEGYGDALGCNAALLNSLKEVLAASEIPAGVLRDRAIKAIKKAEEEL